MKLSPTQVKQGSAAAAIVTLAAMIYWNRTSLWQTACNYSQSAKESLGAGLAKFGGLFSRSQSTETEAEAQQQEHHQQRPQ